MSVALYFIIDRDERSLSDQDTIARVHSFVNDARWKSAQKLSWQPTRINFHLKLGDSLYTGENSSLEIVFKDNTKLILESNSLVTLFPLEDTSPDRLKNPSLHVLYGQFDLISQMETNWKVRGNDGQAFDVKASPESITHFRRENLGNIKVSPLKGAVNIAKNGRVISLDQESKNEIEITEEDFIELSKKSQLSNSTISELPNNNHKIIPNVQFYFDSSSTLEKTSDPETKVIKSEDESSKKTQGVNDSLDAKIPTLTKVKVKRNSSISSSNTSSDSSIINSNGVSKSKQKLANKENLSTLPSKREGTKSKMENSIESATRKPPKGKVPFHESVVYLYKGNQLNIHFMWAEGENDSKFFRIEVANSDLFNPPLISKDINSNKTDLILPGAGKYYWRVRSIYDVDVSPWSETKIFTIQYSN